MLKPCLRRTSVSNTSVLGERKAKGVHTSKIANIPFGSRGIALRLFSHRIRHRSSWRQRPAGKPLKRSGRKTDDPRFQCQSDMVGTSEVDILDAPNINGRSTFGWRNDDPNAYCIVSEAGKDLSTEID